MGLDNNIATSRFFFPMAFAVRVGPALRHDTTRHDSPLHLNWNFLRKKLGWTTVGFSGWWCGLFRGFFSSLHVCYGLALWGFTFVSFHSGGGKVRGSSGVWIGGIIE